MEEKPINANHSIPCLLASLSLAECFQLLLNPSLARRFQCVCTRSTPSLNGQVLVEKVSELYKPLKVLSRFLNLGVGFLKELCRWGSAQ